jgi:5-dehydro-2-deoxygluconokinase
MFAAERARANGASVFFDIDFRADQWHDPRAFGVVARSALASVDIAIGTEAEIKAAAAREGARIVIEHSQISSPEVEGDLAAAIETVLSLGPKALVVKRGAEGASVFVRGEAGPRNARPFPVDVVNVLGAGDAFASGFIYGQLKGWDFERSARMGNATGAIVVTRQGCANFMPYEQEALEFISARGGF